MKGFGPMPAAPRTCHAFFIYNRRLPAVGKPAFDVTQQLVILALQAWEIGPLINEGLGVNFGNLKACIEHVVRAALLTNGGPRSCLSLLQYLGGAAVLHNAPILPEDCTSLVRSQSAIIQNCIRQDARCCLLLSRQFSLSLLPR